MGTGQGRAGNGTDRVYPVPQTALQSFRYGADATAALREGQDISPERTAYYNAIVTYVQDCRPLLNQGQYNLPEPPKLADFDQSLQDYKAQVQVEIAQEAAAAGMTVEEYAAAGFEAPQQDSFSIYQLRNEDSTRDYRFESYDRLQLPV